MKIPQIPLKILNRKIAFSAIVQFGGKIVQLVLASLSLKLISNYLNMEGYGLYAAITEYVLFFSVAANLGIFGNVVRKMADSPRDGKIFFNALILRIGTALFFALTGIIVLIINGSNQTFIFASILFFSSLFFDFITTVCDGALQANYLMGRATFALILGRLINLTVIYLLLKEFGGWSQGVFANSSAYLLPVQLAAVFFAAVLGSLITAALSLYFVRRKIKWSWSIDKSFMVKIFKISLPLGIITILNSLYFRFIPDYLANKVLTGSQFASFNISFRIAQVLSLISTYLMFSALPGLKEYIDAKKWKKAYDLYKKIAKLFALGGFALVVFGSLIGPLAISILTHKKYLLADFWFVLPLMLLLAAISYGYDLILISLFALEKDLWLLKAELLALAFSILIFSGIWVVDDPLIKLFLIISGAIAGETFMVVLGLLKARKEFKKAMPQIILGADLASAFLSKDRREPPSGSASLRV